jgi:hypothetical protein
MRRRFIYDRETDSMVEITAGIERQVNAHTADGALWGDRSYEGMRAPDGSDISSRSKHREYMRLNNLATADDYTQSWAKAEQQRNEYRTTGKGGAVTRDDIARAIAQHQTR